MRVKIHPIGQMYKQTMDRWVDIQDMISIPRCPLRYNSLVYSGKNSYYVGIGPIVDVELTCKF